MSTCLYFAWHNSYKFKQCLKIDTTDQTVAHLLYKQDLFTLYVIGESRQVLFFNLPFVYVHLYTHLITSIMLLWVSAIHLSTDTYNLQVTHLIFAHLVFSTVYHPLQLSPCSVYKIDWSCFESGRVQCQFPGYQQCSPCPLRHVTCNMLSA